MKIQNATIRNLIISVWNEKEEINYFNLSPGDLKNIPCEYLEIIIEEKKQ